MEDRSNMKNPTRLSPLRAGKASLGGVLLGVGAAVSACVAGYAMWTLGQPIGSTPTQEVQTHAMGSDEQADGQAGGQTGGEGIAQTQVIEEILGAVQVYVRNEQFGQATTVLEHAAGQYPGDQELQLALGDLYMMQKMYEQAYGRYVTGIEIGPSTAGAEFTAGTLANMLDRIELAEMHYSSAMRLDAKNPDTPMYLAAIHLKMNRLSDAKKNLAIAGKLAPDRAQVYAMRSAIAMRENKVSIALEQIRRARAIEPNHAGWLIEEAKVLKRSGKAEEAVGLLVSLPEDQLAVIETASVLAECYGMLGRPGDAASRLMDVAQKHPEDGMLAFEVALWLERAGERASAIEWGNTAGSLGHPRARAWIESLP